MNPLFSFVFLQCNESNEPHRNWRNLSIPQFWQPHKDFLEKFKHEQLRSLKSFLGFPSHLSLQSSCSFVGLQPKWTKWHKEIKTTQNSSDCISITLMSILFKQFAICCLVGHVQMHPVFGTMGTWAKTQFDKLKLWPSDLQLRQQRRSKRTPETNVQVVLWREEHDSSIDSQLTFISLVFGKVTMLVSLLHRQSACFSVKSELCGWMNGSISWRLKKDEMMRFCNPLERHANETTSNNFCLAQSLA